MSKRIFLGETGGRMLFRITPPGYDADNLAHPAVISSDNDYLKVHMRGDPGGVVMNVMESGQGRYRYVLRQDFPDLGYIPIVFYVICIDSEGELNNRVIYPYDSSADTDRYPIVSCAVSTNAIWWDCLGYTFEQTIKVKYVIFKNRLV